MNSKELIKMLGKTYKNPNVNFFICESYDISPIMQLGLQPIFCDVDPITFSFNKDHLLSLFQILLKFIFFLCIN